MDRLTWIIGKIDRFSKISLGIAAFCLLFMLLLINVEVLGRYFFGYSTLISDEYSGYLYVGCSFLGFAYSFRSGSFLRVEILTSRLSFRIHRFFYLGACIAGFIFSLIITWEVAKLPYESYIYHSKSLQASATPLFIPQLFLPIGTASLMIVFLDGAVRTLLKKEEAIKEDQNVKRGLE